MLACRHGLKDKLHTVFAIVILTLLLLVSWQALVLVTLFFGISLLVSGMLNFLMLAFVALLKLVLHTGDECRFGHPYMRTLKQAKQIMRGFGQSNFIKIVQQKILATSI